MCDIFGAKCKYCGKTISFHLGDFLTKRNEVEVVCEECFNKEQKNFVLWKADNKLIKVKPLTINAFLNLDVNYPNEDYLNLIKVEFEKEYIKKLIESEK